jgi:hypothetical protein
MQYKCKNVAALHIVLGGLPAKMRVEIDSGIGISARTVGELRKVTAWPGNLAIATPEHDQPDRAVKLSKASAATRYPPRH